jgi:hypothetical protein
MPRVGRSRTTILRRVGWGLSPAAPAGCLTPTVPATGAHPHSLDAQRLRVALPAAAPSADVEGSFGGLLMGDQDEPVPCQASFPVFKDGLGPTPTADVRT